MGMFKRIARAAFETRSSLENPQVPLSFPAEWLLDIFNGGRTDSGVRVSEMTALQVGTVYACCNIISGAFAALPLFVYELITKDDRLGKKKAPGHNLWNILHNEPNEEMTSFTFFKTLQIHALLWGNAFAELQRDGANQVTALWPRNPSRTRAIRIVQPITQEGTLYPAGTLMYETSEPLVGMNPELVGENADTIQIGRRRLVLAEDMIHVPGLSLDGRVGQSTTYLARQIIGLSLATEKYGAKFFGNGARPAGILTLPSKMEDKAIENLRRSWAEAHGGENQFKVAVLEAGVKFEKVAATPNEGQMLETRAFQRADICSVFNVPLHMVAAGEEKSSGKSSVEQSSIEFVNYCLGPWITAWEKELSRKLFPKVGRNSNKFFPKFDTRRLLYPDAASRATLYGSGRQWGYLTKNDIRDWEDLNPDDSGAGDLYWAPVNMQNDLAMVEGGVADGTVPPDPAQVDALNGGLPAPGKKKPAAKKPAKPVNKAKAGRRSTDGEIEVPPMFEESEIVLPDSETP